MRESICAAHYIKAFFVTTEINIFIEKEICSRSCEKILSVKKNTIQWRNLIFCASICIFIRNRPNVTETKILDRLLVFYSIKLHEDDRILN